MQQHFSLHLERDPDCPLSRGRNQAAAGCQYRPSYKTRLFFPHAFNEQNPVEDEQKVRIHAKGELARTLLHEKDHLTRCVTSTVIRLIATIDASTIKITSTSRFMFLKLILISFRAFMPSFAFSFCPSALGCAAGSLNATFGNLPPAFGANLLEFSSGSPSAPTATPSSRTDTAEPIEPITGFAGSMGASSSCFIGSGAGGRSGRISGAVTGKPSAAGAVGVGMSNPVVSDIPTTDAVTVDTFGVAVGAFGAPTVGWGVIVGDPVGTPMVGAVTTGSDITGAPVGAPFTIPPAVKSAPFGTLPGEPTVGSGGVGLG